MKTISKETFDNLQKLRHAYINGEGKEVLNPVPREIDAGLDRPLTLDERVQRAVAWHISKEAEKQEMETLRDAMDFDLEDDDVQYLTGYQMESIPEVPPDPIEPPEDEKKVEEPATDPAAAPASEG